MSVAKCLGVDDLDALNMRGLRAEWSRWRRTSNDLPDVDDLMGPAAVDAGRRAAAGQGAFRGYCMDQMS